MAASARQKAAAALRIALGSSDTRNSSSGSRAAAAQGAPAPVGQQVSTVWANCVTLLRCQLLATGFLPLTPVQNTLCRYQYMQRYKVYLRVMQKAKCPARVLSCCAHSDEHQSPLVCCDGARSHW